MGAARNCDPRTRRRDHLTNRCYRPQAYGAFSLAVDVSGGRKLFESATGDARQAKQMSFGALEAMRAEIRAAAAVMDVALPETGSSGIEGHLEHARSGTDTTAAETPKGHRPCRHGRCRAHCSTEALGY